MKTQMIIQRAALLSTMLGMAAFTLQTRAETIYIGDAAAYGQTMDAADFTGTRDSVVCTYVYPTTGYINNTGAALTVNITEVNFVATTADGAGFIKPILTVFSAGNPASMTATTDEIRAAANYTLVWVGDAISVTADGLYNTALTGQSITLQPGQWLTAGLTTSVKGMVIQTVPNAALPQEFAANTNVLGNVGELLPSNGITYGLQRTMAYNIGIEIIAIPEPSAWALLLTGAGLLTLFRRKRVA